MKIAIVLGIRPEIIKFSPIVENIEYFIIHTGQHYSYSMDKVFFNQLKISQPKYKLNVGSGTHAEETGKMMIGIEKVLLKERPTIVLVQGDTNATLAGALAAVKMLIKVGHVEAGLRSFDRSMPEEINRVLVDHVSDYLFAPTENSKNNLRKEGISNEKIFVTGNTIVDAVYRNIKLAESSNILKKLDLKENEYILVTIHRQENVDNSLKLKNIIKGLKLVRKFTDLPIIYPIHPRSRKRIKEFNLEKHINDITLVDPLDYFSFLKLEQKARLILTDSGGVQEEACILHVPCITLRNNTERPETIDIGANILVGTDPDKILLGVKVMWNNNRRWKNPFGDGRASQRIIEIICSSLN